MSDGLGNLAFSSSLIFSIFLIKIIIIHALSCMYVEVVLVAPLHLSQRFEHIKYQDCIAKRNQHHGTLIHSEKQISNVLITATMLTHRAFH